MSEHSYLSLFFTTVPDLQNLCTLFLTFPSCSDEGEIRNKQFKSCREILSLHSDVIASPVLGSFGGISVIMAITFFKKGIIQAYAHSRDLQVGSPQRLLPSTLQSCLSYSLTARLAPNWNRAGQYLIEGRDFLCESGQLRAVVMELSMTETQLCLSVEASTVRLPPVLLEDFDVPPLVLNNFLINREAVLQTTLPNNWCYILPSMKRGQIISVSRKVPQECPFQSYSKLQDHWRNMYGYHLPPLNEDEVVYCSVYFRALGEKLFTYPLSCIRIQPVQRFPRVDLQGVLEAFMSDLSKLLENVCGSPVQMTRSPSYHTAELRRPVCQVSSAPPANLTTTFSGRLVLTQLPSSRPLGKKTLSGLSSHWPLSQPQTLTNKSTIFKSLPYSCTMPCLLPRPLLPCISPSSHISPIQSHHPPKLVPIFRKKSLSLHVNIPKIVAEKQQKQAEAECRLVSGVEIKRPQPSSLTSFSSFSSSSSSSSLAPANLPLKLRLPPAQRASVLVNSQTQPSPETSVKDLPKNKRRGDTCESQPKKPKVSVQEVDVAQYAKNNQLAKVNAATLQAWLRGRGVTVRSKDKKEELVSKVMRCLYEP